MVLEETKDLTQNSVIISILEKVVHNEDNSMDQQFIENQGLFNGCWSHWWKIIQLVLHKKYRYKSVTSQTVQDTGLVTIPEPDWK